MNGASHARHPMVRAPVGHALGNGLSMPSVGSRSCGVTRRSDRLWPSSSREAIGLIKTLSFACPHDGRPDTRRPSRLRRRCRGSEVRRLRHVFCCAEEAAVLTCARRAASAPTSSFDVARNEYPSHVEYREHVAFEIRASGLRLMWGSPRRPRRRLGRRLPRPRPARSAAGLSRGVTLLGHAARNRV